MASFWKLHVADQLGATWVLFDDDHNMLDTKFVPHENPAPVEIPAVNEEQPEPVVVTRSRVWLVSLVSAIVGAGLTELVHLVK